MRKSGGSQRGAALESSVVAHALVELESQLIGLRTQLAVAESIFDLVKKKPSHLVMDVSNCIHC